MSNMVDDIICDIEDEEYRRMSKLEDEVFYNNDKESEKELAKLCQKHGITLKEYIQWCRGDAVYENLD